MQDDERLARIERALEELSARVARLEPAAPPPPPREPAFPKPPPPPREFALPPEPAGPRLDLEDLVGGRVLAWVGGAAVLVGLVFFLGMAITRGWIDEPTRTVLAFLGSAALLGVGVWLHEAKGRTDAALTAVSVGIFGLYATIVVATTVYDLVGASLGLLFAGLVGAAATTLAVRWQTPVIGVFGILGALLAPVFVDAGTSRVALAFMAIALAAAVGVVLWQRWNWLALLAFLVSTPQLAAWGYDEYEQHLAVVLVVLVLFWALYVVAALGYELRTRSRERLPYASWFLVLGAVAVLAGGGYAALHARHHPDGSIAWLVGVAVAHVVLGIFALRRAINREIGSLLIAAALVLTALAFADALGGPALVAGWGVQAVVLAYLARSASDEPDRFGSDAERLLGGAVVYLVLAAGHVLLFEARPSALRHGVGSLGNAAAALVVVAVAAGVVARLLRETRRDVAEGAQALAAVALVYLGSVAIVDRWGAHPDGSPRQGGQVALSAYWTLLGVAALVAGLVRDVRRLRLGGLVLLGLAVVKVFVYDLAALEQIYRVLSFVALGLLLLASAFAYQRVRRTP